MGVLGFRAHGTADRARLGPGRGDLPPDRARPARPGGRDHPPASAPATIGTSSSSTCSGVFPRRSGSSAQPPSSTMMPPTHLTRNPSSASGTSGRTARRLSWRRSCARWMVAAAHSCSSRGGPVASGQERPGRDGPRRRSRRAPRRSAGNRRRRCRAGWHRRRARSGELGVDDVLDGLGLGDLKERAQGPEVVVDRGYVHLRRRRQLTQPDRVLSLLGQQLLGGLDQPPSRPAATLHGGRRPAGRHRARKQAGGFSG